MTLGFNGFQASGFQYSGLQIPFGEATEESTGHGKYVYQTPYQRVKEEEQREKLRKEKSDLEKLAAVLAENERKAALAAESKALAKKRADQLRLEQLEQEYLTEIARLLMVRDELIRRVRQSEEALILMIAMRRRLRTVQWQDSLAIN